MDASVSQIAIVVENVEAALDFYTGKVGFAKKADVQTPGYPRWVTVGPDGQDIEIALISRGTEASRGVRPGSGLPVTLRVADCSTAFRELSSRGVKFVQDSPQELPWGRAAQFTDPDGNMFSILQPKA